MRFFPFIHTMDNDLDQSHRLSKSRQLHSRLLMCGYLNTLVTLSWLFDSTSSAWFNMAFCLSSVLAGTALCALASSRPAFLVPDLIFRSLLSTLASWSLLRSQMLASQLWSCHVASLVFGFALQAFEVHGLFTSSFGIRCELDRLIEDDLSRSSSNSSIEEMNNRILEPFRNLDDVQPLRRRRVERAG